MICQQSVILIHIPFCPTSFRFYPICVIKMRILLLKFKYIIIMKKNLLFNLAGAIIILVVASCSKDAETIIVDSAMPQGSFVAEKSGTFIDQNAAGSVGLVSLGTDEEGAEFIKLSSDFSTSLATGTVTLYGSTSMDFIADPGAGNPDLRLIGIVQDSGEMFFKLDPSLEDKFTHVILWCGTANIPFGYAALN